jgi:CheY-like chemotaxis protein
MATSDPTRVLLVEQDREDRQVDATSLRGAGFRVTEAHNGLQALQTALENRTDAVVAGLAIPGVDGFELCRRLRRAPSTVGIGIVAVAGPSASREERERAERAGADAVLVRPFDAKKLVREVQRVAAQSRDLSLRARESAAETHNLTLETQRILAETRVVRDHMRRLRERNNALREARADFLDLPGLRLTPEDGARLWKVDVDMCTRLLDSMVDERFLVRTRDGRYKRA